MSIIHIIGGKNDNLTLTVMLDGQTYVLNNSNPQFDIAVEAIKNDDEDAVRRAVNMKQTIIDTSCGNLELRNGTIYHDGEVLNHSLVDRILKMFAEGFDVNPLLKFLENLLQNPSYRARNELYGFLSACSLPITGDGYFMAYKKVQADYLDIYTSSMDNSIGKTVSMKRNEVDEDSDRTCSAGLHVCSQSYLQHYGCASYGNTGKTDRVLLVKVNPRDVVAVPKDYDNAKMRVCKYTVEGELENTQDSLEKDFTNEYDDEPKAEPTVTVKHDVDDFNDRNDVDDFEDACDDLADAVEVVEIDLEDFFNELFDATIPDEVEEDTDFEIELPEDNAPISRRTSLTPTDVRAILSEADDNWTMVASANAHDISPRQIGRIRRGEAWADIKEQYERDKKV